MKVNYLYIVWKLNTKNSEKQAVTVIFGVPFDDITSSCKVLSDLASAYQLIIIKTQTGMWLIKAWQAQLQMWTFIAFIDEYLRHLTSAVVKYLSNEIPLLLKECRTNCTCYPEGREEAWLKQLLIWCKQTKSGCNHVYNIFNDNCMLATCMHAHIASLYNVFSPMQAISQTLLLSTK